MSWLVSLRGVSVRVGSTTILRDVDLDLEAGEILGLFGPNGAGKTTLLRVMATLLPPTAGSGTVLGADLGGHRYDVRTRIGFIGHTPSLYPELTLRENLRFAADLGGFEADVAERALATVGLEAAADRRADHTSHGMQRRAELAREIMRDPDLLLLDEPHSALDRDAAHLVEALVERVVTAGGAAVLVSHDRERVESVAGRSVELKAGTLV